MAIEVGQGPVNLYEGIIFSPEEVNPNTTIPEGNVDLGNLMNPVNITLEGDNSSSGDCHLWRISLLAVGSTIREDYFYEYNNVIYRCITEHTWSGTFNLTNFIAQGLVPEKEIFIINDDSTTVLTLSTSNTVGEIVMLTVNGIEYYENIDFTVGGTGNKTITFNEALPYLAEFSPTYVKVTITSIVS